jgi:hypothetical protein
MSYSFNGPPEPALLDVASIAADTILLLDSYFSVVVSNLCVKRASGFKDGPQNDERLVSSRFQCLGRCRTRGYFVRQHVSSDFLLSVTSRTSLPMRLSAFEVTFAPQTKISSVVMRKLFL